MDVKYSDVLSSKHRRIGVSEFIFMFFFYCV